MLDDATFREENRTYICIYLEATDSLGYLHRMLIHHWKEQNGAMAEAVDASEYIYDSNGVQMFP